ncbi:hypothetical protein LEMLEM_LOCUS26052, partial [Lemmus lemmus]
SRKHKKRWLVGSSHLPSSPTGVAGIRVRSKAVCGLIRSHQAVYEHFGI